MDIFLEKIVKKKRDASDVLIIGGSITLAIILIAAIIVLLGPYGTSLLISAAIIYLTYLIITSRRIEYEYAFTNGELDIDKITNKKKRKNLINSNCREFEIFAKADSDKLSSYVEEIKDRIMAVSSLDSEDIYCFVVNKKSDEDGRTQSTRVIVFFEPNEKMLKSIKTMIPRKVFE
ncbi:DUF6106 family protein [Acetivibrio mesophilus]|uniref:Uncharacterized protein n=1 Tax=Acetivibrio mesophilus TaxID=2487273 RepID=A0A4Q0I1S7_9FIRM|nr:DUF6106 family protein [Acetivibrio mesophilus]ODM26756.1 hypothetical protein A7W90_11330 [Clostridium sp. Bc-iso-3]RXE58106.1 hypothetical protein EFD62_13895 [Acetivibrio mesophilus]